MKGGDDEGMKDSFVVHTSFYEPIKGLSDKQLGRLFRMLFEYQMGNKVQVDDDMGMALKPNHQAMQMNAPNKKYESTVSDRTEAKIGTMANRLKRFFENGPDVPEPVYKCPPCKDRGWLTITGNDGYVYAAQCECAIRKQYKNICKNAGFVLEEAKTLSDYQELNEMTQYAKVAATSYIRDFDTIRKQERNWFIILGQSGSGKTMVGRAIVKALIERARPVRAIAVKFQEMMQKLKAKSNAEDYEQILDRYTDCELLFIDDVLKSKAHDGELTSADITHLFNVLDHRYDAKKPTIITSECTSSRLDELDEAIYCRMTERAYAEIILEGEENNYRKRL